MFIMWWKDKYNVIYQCYVSNKRTKFRYKQHCVLKCKHHTKLKKADTKGYCYTCRHSKKHKSQRMKFRYVTELGKTGFSWKEQWKLGVMNMFYILNLVIFQWLCTVVKRNWAIYFQKVNLIGCRFSFHKPDHMCKITINSLKQVSYYLIWLIRCIEANWQAKYKEQNKN